MNRNTQRNLTASVSAIAIGIAMPAFADGPGKGQTTIAPSVDESLTITSAGEVHESGVTQSGPGVQSATVNDVPSGMHSQTGVALVSSLELELLNEGTATVIADANAGPGALSGAIATITTGVNQEGAAATDASLIFNNTGSLGVSALADAEGTEALAIGVVEDGVRQTANAGPGGNASAGLTNTSADTLSVSADATASGVTSAVAVAAVSDDGIEQDADAVDGGDASVSLDNSGTLNVSTGADASASDGDAIAAASIADGIDQEAEASGGGNASAGLTNTSAETLGVSADATASGVTSAVAVADIEAGTEQNALADDGGDASVSLDNSGTLDVSADADASASDGGATAVASIEDGIEQDADADGGGDASVSLDNSGTLNVSTGADASASDGSATAVANIGDGIDQEAEASGGGNASVGLTNSSAETLGVSTDATASGVTSAVAVADIESGIEQDAEADGGGDASVSLDNSGALNVSAGAGASASDGDATAVAGIDSGVDQYAEADGGGEASATATNAGSINLLAAADAVASGTGTDDSAQAAGSARGINQEVIGSTASFTNSGAFNVVVTADADGDEFGFATATAEGIEQDVSGADASAFVSNTSAGTINVAASASASGDVAGAGAEAFGVDQIANATGPALVSFSNGGNFNVDADAAATGVSDGSASADALGVAQEASGASAQFAFGNSGTFTVDAVADAAGSAPGTAFADAVGYVAQGDPMSVSASNTGTMAVTARANGDTSADAFAGGMGFFTDGGAETLAGTIANGGTLTVVANASGPAPDSAEATGIFMESGVNNAALTNTGTLSVSAITTGGTSEANGIVVENNGLGTPGAGDVFTLNNNGGAIIARVSTDGGATWRHGTAIDTTEAPNAAVINLRGAGADSGRIYGNIDISDDDVINVLSGETRFDGKVNSDMGRRGQLNIRSGGTLYMQDRPQNNPAYDGPSKVWVDDFNIVPGGTLALQLPVFASGTAHQPGNRYPQIFANTANISGGTLEVRPSSPNGLYANSYFYNNIIDSNALTGRFAVPVAVSTGTPLLQFSAIYDDAENVDLNMTRIGFGDVPGLTINQSNTGGGIENVYAPTLTGPFAGMLGNLFLVTADDYPDALDQLSGDQYAGYLQGLRNHSMQLNSLISDQIDCAISIQGPQKCRERDGDVRVWLLGSYNDVSVDTDINAPGYDSKNWSALLGIDYTVGNFTFGAFGGYRDTKMTFDRNNGHIKADGWQAGLFGAYDVGSFYIRGIGSYSDLSGESRRDIAILSTQGTAHGEPDVKITSLYGEAGARLNLGSSSWLTPFAALDYTKVKLKAFTETGVPGANLGYNNQSEDQTSLLAGLKWAGNFGGIVPEAKVAWRYDLNSALFGVDAFFDDAPAGSDFRVFAPDTPRNTVVAGLSLAALMGEQFTGRVGYQYRGRFNSDLNDHAFYGSLTYRFGGTSAPPPAPPPPPAQTAPPPPPPPPQAQPTCNKGPYIVFFDWDRSDITAEASMVLDSAVSAYQYCDRVPVMLAGHADRSGSARYNVGLSERRNASVRDYLTGRGIPDSSITSQAFGESQPRVPTADGVRELQNRRVEITYGPGSGN
jgi:trimeric autotransporter adhesin